MRKRKTSGDVITGKVEGSNTGNIAIGKDIQMSQITQSALPGEIQALQEAWFQEFAALQQKIQNADVPPDKKIIALDRANDLKEEVSSGNPDQGQMKSVEKWFAKHLPSLLGTVTSLVVHPIVGKLVEAGGEALSSHLFGEGKGS